MESGNIISDLTDGKVNCVSFGGDVPALGFSVEKWRDVYYNNEIDPKTQTPYGYRIKTDDGTVFGSEINKRRKANGLRPI